MILLLASQWAAVTKSTKIVPATWAKELVEIPKNSLSKKV